MIWFENNAKWWAEQETYIALWRSNPKSFLLWQWGDESILTCLN